MSGALKGTAMRRRQRCSVGLFYPAGCSSVILVEPTQSSAAQVAGGPPEHSRPAQHCAVDVQGSPSSVHSAAQAFGIRGMPNWCSNSDNWFLRGELAAFAAGSMDVSSLADTDCERATQTTTPKATGGLRMSNFRFGVRQKIRSNRCATTPISSLSLG